MMLSLEKIAAVGSRDALVRFKLAAGGSFDAFLGGGAPAAQSAGNAGASILDKLKGFGQGQLGAAKSLGANLRGGLGFKPNPALAGVGDLGRGMHGPQAHMGELQRHGAIGNLKTLAPTLAVAGGAYLLHRHNQEKQLQQQRMQQMYGGDQGGSGYQGY